MAKDLFKLKREFLEYCEIEKGQSFLTIDNYDRYLSRFLEWLKNEIKSETLNPKSETKKDCHSEFISESNETLKQVQGDNCITGNPLQTTDYKLLPKLIDQEIIRKYRLYVNRLKGSNGGGLKASTQNHHVLALRAFLRYLSFTGESSISPEKLTLAKTGDREVSFLNREEYSRLLDAPDTAKIDGLRDKAMLEMLFSTGLRVSELCDLKLGQLNFERGEIAVLGKGKKLRVVFLSEVAIRNLIEYLIKRNVLKSQTLNSKSQINSKSENSNDQIEYHPRPEAEGYPLGSGSNIVPDNPLVDSRLDARGPFQGGNDKAEEGEPCNSLFIIHDSHKDEPVFISNRKRKMNSRAIERLVQKYSKIAGISKNVTPHTLRHTFATDLLQAGADIRSVQSLLGHANISTTQVYTHVTDKHLREIHQKFHDNSRNNTDDNAV